MLKNLRNWLLTAFIVINCQMCIITFATASPSTFTINATPTGTLQNGTLTITIYPDQQIVGKAGSIFVAANLLDGSWYSATSSAGWQKWDSTTTMPAYLTVSALSAITTITPIQDMNITPYIRAKIFVGYGIDYSSMMSANTYDTVYVIRNCFPEQISCAQLAQRGMDYPFVNDRQNKSYLFVSGGVYPYQVIDASISKSTVRVPGNSEGVPVPVLLRQLGENDPGDVKRTPIVAYGANAAPRILADKFTRIYGDHIDYNGSSIIPVTKATLRDFDITWLPHIGANGGMPATISASPGTKVEIWLTWLDDNQLQLMNQSEATGQTNSLYSLNIMPKGNIIYSDLKLYVDALIYVSCYGALRAENGHPLAIEQLHAIARRFIAKNTIEYLRYAANQINENVSGFQFVTDNVRYFFQNKSELDRRNSALKQLAAPSPVLEPKISCQ